MRRLSLLAPALLLLGGCLLSNISPTTRLRDATNGLNDEVRWSRMDLAVERVAPIYQDRFSERHARWGHPIQIADDQIVGMRLDHDRNGATAVVVYSWYLETAMILHQTTVRQVWKRRSGEFYLTSERVLGGDARLFEVPPHAHRAASDTPPPSARLASADAPTPAP